MLTLFINISILEVILIYRAQQFFSELRLYDFGVDDEEVDHGEYFEDDPFLGVDVG